MAFPIYIQADTADFDSPLDLRRSETPSFWSGTDIEFKIAVYEFGAIKDVSKIQSITVEIKAMGAKGARPLPGASALMSKTVTNINDDLTSTEWAAFTDCHASVKFTAEESAVPAGTHWIVISAITKISNVIENLTLAAGEIVVEQDGHGAIGEVVVSDGSAYTKDASDARYARRVLGAGIYVDAGGGSDETGVRGRADLPFATLAAACAAASAGDVVYIAPGSYAAATIGKTLSFVFSPGATLAAPLVIEADGVQFAGKVAVDALASYIATSASARTVSIGGVLAVNKPFGSAITVTGGLLVDTSTSAITHPGLTSADLVTSLAWTAVTGKPSAFAPSAHAASHATGGADALTPASIGAAATADLTAEATRAASAEALKAPLATPVITEASAARTLTLGDANSLLRSTSATAVTITVPLAATVAFPVGTTILVRQAGSGQVTLAAATGVTLNTSRTLKTLRQHATIALTKIGTDEWDVTGERALS